MLIIQDTYAVFLVMIDGSKIIFSLFSICILIFSQSNHLEYDPKSSCSSKRLYGSIGGFSRRS